MTHSKFSTGDVYQNLLQRNMYQKVGDSVLLVVKDKKKSNVSLGVLVGRFSIKVGNAYPQWHWVLWHNSSSIQHYRNQFHTGSYSLTKESPLTAGENMANIIQDPQFSELKRSMRQKHSIFFISVLRFFLFSMNKIYVSSQFS